MNKLKNEVIKSAIGELENIDSDSVRKQYRFDKNFVGFSGHFPGYPLLPAFVQIMLGIVLLETQKGFPIELNTVSNAKFLLQIRPEQELTVECRDCTPGGKMGSDIKIFNSDGLAASFRVVFSIKGAAAYE